MLIPETADNDALSAVDRLLVNWMPLSWVLWGFSAPQLFQESLGAAGVPTYAATAARPSCLRQGTTSLSRPFSPLGGLCRLLSALLRGKETRLIPPHELQRGSFI